MALEAELRSRVDRSLREMEEIVSSLHEVTRLADAQQASVETLSRVAATMDTAGGQFRALLESVGRSGTALQAAAEAVEAADPAAVMSLVDEVGVTIAAVGAQVDATVQLAESAASELENIRGAVEGTRGVFDAAAKAHALTLERLETAVTAKIRVVDGRIQAVDKRVRAAIMAAWVAVGFAALAAAAGVVGSIR